jgi:hypothetical protein
MASLARAAPFHFGNSAVVTAVILKFPRHPIHVVRDARGGDWLVLWRGWSWSHASYGAARADAHVIANLHGERIIDDHEDAWGGAA